MHCISGAETLGAISLLGGGFWPGWIDGSHPEDVAWQGDSLEALVNKDALHLTHHGGRVQLINEEGEELLWGVLCHLDEGPQLGPHVSWSHLGVHLHGLEGGEAADSKNCSQAVQN